MSLKPSGRLLSVAEVAALIRPGDNPDEIASQVRKEMSRNGIRSVHIRGYPADEVELLKEYRSLPWKDRMEWTFQEWKVAVSTEASGGK